jgi:CHAD domain-containing protein
MHAFVETDTGEKPALQPNAAIGPAVRAIAGNILAKARTAITDPERPDQNAVHDFRRAMKQWRALMRLLAPFIPDAGRWRHDARDHARSLSHARDGAAALNAFDGLVKKGTLALSPRSIETIRGRIEALRGGEEQAVLTPALHDALLAWLDAAAAGIAHWPLDPFDFSSIAAQLADAYRNARRRIPADWSAGSAEDLHSLRQRVVDLRYQMELVEPLWPRFGRMWTEEAERLRDRLGRCQDLEVLKRLTAPHQPLAPWRSRLTPAIDERSAEAAQRAARIAHRLFAEKPKAFRHRIEALWEHAR